LQPPRTTICAVYVRASILNALTGRGVCTTSPTQMAMTHMAFMKFAKLALRAPQRRPWAAGWGAHGSAHRAP
jgi:glycosyltransferase involved in cell wall biosynthesis